MKTSVYRFFGITLVFLLVSASVMAQDSAQNKSYSLQPGDILEVTVWKEPDLQREVLVAPDGGISFPLVGQVDTTGMSIKQLNTIVKDKIAKYIPDPIVTVSIKQMLGNRIYVLGKVYKSGEFVVVQNVDVLQALSMAGGLNPFADRSDIQILRRGDKGQTSTTFSYDAVEKGDLSKNIILSAGDVILVP